MSKLLVLVGIIAALIAFFKLRAATSQVKTTPVTVDQYQKINAFFTPAEQHFLITLEEAIHNKPVRLFAKARLADIIKVAPTVPKNHFWGAFNKIAAKHVDFLLVHPNSFTPLLVIELDDASHKRSERKARDRFVDEIMAQTGIPILHIPAAGQYSRALLESMINNAMR